MAQTPRKSHKPWHRCKGEPTGDRRLVSQYAPQGLNPSSVLLTVAAADTPFKSSPPPIHTTLHPEKPLASASA